MTCSKIRFIRHNVLLIGALLFIICTCGKDEPTEPPKNNPPIFLSPLQTEASGGINYVYRTEIDDSDGPDTIITYLDYPDWLTPSGDSIYGIPEDGLDDTIFSVIFSDGINHDTQMVIIDMIPSLVVYGDTRSGHEAHQAIVNRIITVHSSAVFHVGDLVNNGNLQSDWDIFNSIVSGMLAMSEFFPALGNHEYQSPLYFANFELPGNEQWYAVDRNRIHFIILNTCVDISAGSEQYQWLLSDLAAIPENTLFTAAVFHHPPYSTGQHAEDELGLREILVPLFGQYGFDIAFTGHDHDYERSYCGGIYYIVAGGGGAPLRGQARSHPCSQLFLEKYHFCKLSRVDNRLIVNVFDIDGLLIDHYEIIK
ncbi:MAG: metallophosphoesterase [Candidatus Zixiibacteriota bacterium]